MQKRSTELGFLDKVNLFKNLDRFEKLSLLDGLRAQWFSRGEVIVREGEIGDLFYIVEEGHVECWAKILNGKKQQVDRVIRKLTSGDHFGELALINNERRTLTVKCGSLKAKLLTLDRDTFTRILGSIEQYLHLDYSDFCRSIMISDEDEVRRDLTVNLSRFREEVDGQEMGKQNWTSENSVGDALVDHAQSLNCLKKPTSSDFLSQREAPIKTAKMSQRKSKLANSSEDFRTSFELSRSQICFQEQNSDASHLRSQSS